MSEEKVEIVRAAGSSAEFEVRIGTLWNFGDGKALSLQGFPEREKALEAAGLQA